MHPRDPLRRPPVPDRRFPDDAGPAGEIPARARVDLVFDGSRLTGSAGGYYVSLRLDTGGLGSARGTIAGVPVSATWETGNNYRVYPDVPADLAGSFAGQEVELHASFRLDPGYFLDHGSIDGHIGGRELRATVERASGGLGSTSTVAVDGHLDGTGFELYAAVDGPNTAAKIRGSVAGRPVRIDATRDGLPGDRRTQLTGSYEGPHELLAVAAGALLYFL